MLLLLESKPLCNEEIYLKQIQEIIAYYYRDNKGKKNFRPLFLLNDILRFWRTLCLNYEYTRGDKDRPWRKKNFNLKYSRMLTVFSTVLYIISNPIPSEEDLFSLCKLSPLERLSQGLDKLDSNQLSTDSYLDFLRNYEFFLHTKETSNLNINAEAKSILNQKALQCSRFLFSALNDNKIDSQYRQYLVI